MKKLLTIILFLMLTACGKYVLVQAGIQRVGDYTLKLDRSWNKSPKLPGFLKGTEVWTVDGIELNSVILFPLIGQDKTLFKNRNKSDPYPKYDHAMLPTEVQEWVIASITKFIGEGRVLVETKNLKPANIDGNPGFVFDMNHKTRNNIEYSGKVLSWSSDQGVYLIYFSAVSNHYYDELLPGFNQMLASLRYYPLVVR